MVLVLQISTLLITVLTANALIFELPSGAHKRSTRHRDISRKVKRAPNLPSAWSYYGCITDGPQRTLNAMSFTSDSMTVESCVNFCDGHGYVYAGLEYSRECYCDNTLQNGATTTTDCNLLCSGDSSEVCGGGYKLSTYKSSNAVATPLSSYNGYVYKGCYTDSIESRSVPVGMGFTGSLTPQKCIDACAAQGYSYAGLEYAQECYCGNTNSGTLADETGCNMPCAGDGAHLCGGGNRLTLYQSGTFGRGDPSWSYVNCYTDSVGQRTLPTPLGIASMTIGKCEAACGAAGFLYAGVEYGGECWCGNTILGTATVAASGACNMACNGDATEICGGGNAINIYRSGSSGPSVVPSYGQWTSQGCYVDSVAQRSLPVAMAVSGGPAAMTVESCLDACGTNGYTYAGTEYGGECYCGSSIAAGKAEDGRCSMSCNGNPAEICGGPNGLSLYILTTSSTTQTTQSSTSSSTSTSQTSSASSTSQTSSTSSTSLTSSTSSTSQTSQSSQTTSTSTYTTPTGTSTSTSPSSTPTGASCPSKPACVRQYTSIAGDTCASIALAYGLQAADIQTANAGLNCNSIGASTSVCIPSSCTSVYVTQGSTTCDNVGTLVGVTAQVILASNPTINCNSIAQGATLRAKGLGVSSRTLHAGGRLPFPSFGHRYSFSFPGT
ncbi:hypothetical protein PIIN_06786 [Serendipita indica DSM 11827]|uniref:Beta-1,3 exoglucanase n=1 Tax=Serendipita indica (strain DSM 11827) TaxID=1109443 RepID=G4TNG9_SERID|nr:hypothetical protein PIIN_06786 [Serendipita indica DSM 11827]